MKSNKKRAKKVVAVLSPKGGVGKSTIVTHTATILNYLYREHDYKVSILDVDFLQQNIYKKRQKDLLMLNENQKFKDKVEKMNIPIYDIETTDENNLIDNIKEMSEETDLLFVDFPGTLLNPIIQKAFLEINYFLIPFYPEEEFEKESTMFFINKIIPILKKSSKNNFIDAAVVFNRYSDAYENMKENPYKEMEAELDKIGFKYFENKIYLRKDLQKHKSTIIPIPPKENDRASFYYIVQEFTKFIMN